MIALTIFTRRKRRYVFSVHRSGSGTFLQEYIENKDDFFRLDDASAIAKTALSKKGPDPAR